jgi:hypothetical protein
MWYNYNMEDIEQEIQEFYGWQDLAKELENTIEATIDLMKEHDLLDSIHNPLTEHIDKLTEL